MSFRLLTFEADCFWTFPFKKSWSSSVVKPSKSAKKTRKTVHGIEGYNPLSSFFFICSSVRCREFSKLEISAIIKKKKNFSKLNIQSSFLFLFLFLHYDAPSRVQTVWAPCATMTRIARLGRRVGGLALICSVPKSFANLLPSLTLKATWACFSFALIRALISSLPEFRGHRIKEKEKWWR